MKLLALVSLASLITAGLALANPEYGRKTGKECNYCHPPNNFNLTAAGKYYKEHGKSLKGYVPSPSKDLNSKGNATPPASQKPAH